MNKPYLYNKAQYYLDTLCRQITERCVGSEGNRAATLFFKQELTALGWAVETSEFEALDWHEGGASLKAEATQFKVFVSPYSLGCSETAELAAVKNIAQLESGHYQGKILLLYGDIAQEQLMPKNFVFYNPEHHRKIIGLLENSGVKAIICATGRNAALAGGVYPFPLIEDGDFDIPSVYMTEEEGQKLLGYAGRQVTLLSDSKRIPGPGYNVSGIKGSGSSQRIVITAHIDSKKGSPGAIDNATGVIVLLLTAELLRDYTGKTQVELVAFNGEDYYAVPGQMDYIAKNQNHFDNILLNVNIDGAAYKEGPSAFSFFNLPDDMQKRCREVIQGSPDLTEGAQWPQGDHSIFIQYGRPALAISSKWFIDNMDSQDITHTPKDNSGIVDCNKIIDIAEAIYRIVYQLST